EFAPRPDGRVSKAMSASARILEIGDFHYVKDQYPERTTLLWTGGRSPLLDRSQYFDCTPARFLRAMAEVRAGRYDLVVVYMGLRSPWHPRWQERLAKIQPIALPAPVIDTGSTGHGGFPQKTVDIFFSGNVAENSWVRRTGMAELEELARRGVKVDVAAERLPPEEFR